MSLATWPLDILPVFDGYSHDEGRDVLPVQFTGGRAEQRVGRDTGPFRSYDLTLRVTPANRLRVDAFLRGQGYGRVSFLWWDPLDYFRAGVSLGTSVTSQTVFLLPTTGDARGDYPVNLPATVLRDDGVAIARTVQTDDRTLTASVAPANGSVMTADLQFYKRVALRGSARWSVLGHGRRHETSLTFAEVAS